MCMPVSMHTFITSGRLRGGCVHVSLLERWDRGDHAALARVPADVARGRRPAHVLQAVLQPGLQHCEGRGRKEGWRRP